MNTSSSAPYVVEPELSGPTPRRVEYTRAARQTRAWLINASAAVFFVLLWASRVDTAFYRRIAAEGVTTRGTVVAIAESTKRSKRYRVQFEYEVPGGRQGWGAERVRERDFGLLSPGDRLAVTYLPSDPARHVLGAFGPRDAERRQSKWNTGVLLAGMLGAAACVGHAVHLAKQRRLLERGVAVPARVVTCHRVAEDGSGGRTYSITYRYDWAPGARALSDRALICGRAHPGLCVPGATFTVLRDPADSVLASPYFALQDVEIAGAAGPRLPA